MARSNTPFIVGNWKMNGLAAALGEIETIGGAIDRGDLGELACAICPPATLIDRARTRAGSRLAIGAQDCAVDESGAHTGDIAAEMLRDAGATLVILGHSERRTVHDESDALVLAKTDAARRAGLLAIICVGETRAQRDAGKALSVVGAHLTGSLPDWATATTVAVAYEPIWAIGTGLVPTTADIAEMHGFIRGRLAEKLGPEGAALRILYGGSVKPDNAAELMAVDDVDGALIGGASLNAADFLTIARAARRA